MPVPEEDDGLIPPLKVMRKRLNGVYSADGFSGPTRRYVLIVALLVGLASVPTLAAITAAPLEDGSNTGAMDVPLLPPMSSGPVQPPWATTGPATPSGPGLPSRSPTTAQTPGGQAGKRVVKPKRSSGRASGSHGGSRPESEGAGSRALDSEGSASRGPAARGADSGGRRSTGSGARHQARYSHRGEGVVVHIGLSGWHVKHSKTSGTKTGCQPDRKRGQGERSHRDDSERSSEPADSGRSQARGRDHTSRTRQFIRSLVNHRSGTPGRSDSRRSAVVEHPQNLRPTPSAEHSDNSHSNQYAVSHTDRPQTGARAYRGSHRAERRLHPDDRRSSRVGGHHDTDQHRDRSSHW